MNNVDMINAVFEGGGAIFLCLNVRRLLRDRSVKGVSLVTTTWWTTWGFWNVYYYRAVTCPASFYAGIAVVAVNAVWLALAVWYARRDAVTLPAEVLRTCRLRCPGGSENGECLCAAPADCPHGQVGQ